MKRLSLILSLLLLATPAQALVVRALDKEYASKIDDPAIKNDNAATTKLLHDWMDSNPNVSDIYYVICNRSLEIKDYALAINSCQKLADWAKNENNPKDAQLGFYNRGVALLEQHDYKQALRSCKDALSIYQPLRQAYACIGQAYLGDDLAASIKKSHPKVSKATRKRLEQSINAYKQAIATPSDTNASSAAGLWFDIGAIYFNIFEDMRNAKEPFETAASLDPKYGGVWYMVGMTNWMLGNTEAARAAQAQARTYDPSQAEDLDKAFKLKPGTRR